MFGLFGGNKKLTLIRELLEQRMRKSGFDDLDYRLQVKRLSNLKLMGTPEALIVTVLETVIKGQKNGMLLTQILQSMEDHRKRLGHNSDEFNDILKLSRSSNPGECVSLYCSYRIFSEHNSLLQPNEVDEVVEQAMTEIPNW